MMGDIMLESKARTVVMDNIRRILQAHYTFIFVVNAIETKFLKIKLVNSVVTKDPWTADNELQIMNCR
jgi:hypothetical protein